MDALEENEDMDRGQDSPVLPTDNHKIHILIHGQIGELALEHIQQHQLALENEPKALLKPGGGNPEGNPINGTAVNQELVNQSPETNIRNSEIAINREAGV